MQSATVYSYHMQHMNVPFSLTEGGTARPTVVRGRDLLKETGTVQNNGQQGEDGALDPPVGVWSECCLV